MQLILPGVREREYIPFTRVGLGAEQYLCKTTELLLALLDKKLKPDRWIPLCNFLFLTRQNFDPDLKVSFGWIAMIVTINIGE